MESTKESLESRILRATSAAKTSELPDFPDDKSDLPSDYEYDPTQGEEEEEEIVEEIAENDLLRYLDQQENPLHIAQRLFYNEVNTVQSQANSAAWKLQCLTCKAIEELYGHGWTTIDGLLDLATVKGAREEAERMMASGQFCQASEISKNNPDDPFRDGSARDDAITWLDAGNQDTLPNLKKILQFFSGPLHHDLAQMIRLNGKTEYQLAYYHPKNARYERHRDAFPTDDPEDTHQRRVTAILYLNPGWTAGDGGELKIFGRAESDGTTDAADRTIPPLLGRLVLFLSGAVDHAVLPANKERFALTAWMR